MVVFDTLYKLSGYAGLVVVGWILGTLAWSAGSGLLAGTLLVAGIVTSAQMWLSLTPAAGLLGSIAAVYWGPTW